MAIVFMYSMAGVLVGLAALPFTSPSKYTAMSIASLASIGTIGLAAQRAMTNAFRTGPTSLLATLQYATIAFSACYGIFYWGETPTFMGLVGLALIVLSGVLAARGMSQPFNQMRCEPANPRADKGEIA